MQNNTAIKIPAELFALSEATSFDGTYELDQLDVGPDTYRFETPLVWHVDVTNTGSALLVAGSVSGSGACACSRCLEDVVYEFEGDVEGYFLLGGVDFDMDEDDEELGEDEFDVLPEDHILDLAPLLNAALMVDAPNMPLCKEDCAGLCPSCGANLNDGPCDCEGDATLEEFERAANPFSALANYSFE